MWVCPTHYTVKTQTLKSWVLEGSLDGESWMEIDRRQSDQVLEQASFVLSLLTPMDFRIIRLTQTSKNQAGDDCLLLSAVEFFGRLSTFFDGIIGYLAEKHGGSVVEKDLLAVTSKSVQSKDAQYALTNVVDLKSASYFSSDNQPSQWICWDFTVLVSFS
jgi:hypothetical protein